MLVNIIVFIIIVGVPIGIISSIAAEIEYRQNMKKRKGSSDIPYTRDDYIRDLYIREHSSGREGMYADIRIKHYEHGRNPNDYF